jgi:hypothetical protein
MCTVLGFVSDASVATGLRAPASTGAIGRTLAAQSFCKSQARPFATRSRYNGDMECAETIPGTKSAARQREHASVWIEGRRSLSRRLAGREIS